MTRVLDERCVVCNSLVWTGLLTCVNCYSPMCYETGFPDVDLANICSLEIRHIDTMPEKTLEKVRTLITRGRRAIAMGFNAQYGIRMPTQEQLKNKKQTTRRGAQQQGKRHDAFIRRCVEKD